MSKPKLVAILQGPYFNSRLRVIPRVKQACDLTLPCSLPQEHGNTKTVMASARSFLFDTNTINQMDGSLAQAMCFANIGMRLYAHIKLFYCLASTAYVDIISKIDQIAMRVKPS